ncbi:B-block_TFIIIC domain-containing protein, partial [Haematococcus lacustris]
SDLSDDRLRRLMERLSSHGFMVRHEIRSFLYTYEVDHGLLHPSTSLNFKGADKKTIERLLRRLVDSNKADLVVVPIIGSYVSGEARTMDVLLPKDSPLTPELGSTIQQYIKAFEKRIPLPASVMRRVGLTDIKVEERVSRLLPEGANLRRLSLARVVNDFQLLNPLDTLNRVHRGRGPAAPVAGTLATLSGAAYQGEHTVMRMTLNGYNWSRMARAQFMHAAICKLTAEAPGQKLGGGRYRKWQIIGSANEVPDLLARCEADACLGSLSHKEQGDLFDDSSKDRFSALLDLLRRMGLLELCTAKPGSFNTGSGRPAITYFIAKPLGEVLRAVS